MTTSGDMNRTFKHVTNAWITSPYVCLWDRPWNLLQQSRLSNLLVSVRRKGRYATTAGSPIKRFFFLHETVICIWAEMEHFCWNSRSSDDFDFGSVGRVYRFYTYQRQFTTADVFIVTHISKTPVVMGYLTDLLFLNHKLWLHLFMKNHTRHAVSWNDTVAPSLNTKWREINCLPPQVGA